MPPSARRTTPSPPPAISSETKRNAEQRQQQLTLHLDLDDLADPEESDRLHDDRAPISIVCPMCSVNSSFMCSGLMNDQRDRQRRRQRQQHVAGEAAVRRVHAHLPQNLEALAHDVGEVVENLGQVAAGLALNRAPRSRRTSRRGAARARPAGRAPRAAAGRSSAARSLLELDADRRRAVRRPPCPSRSGRRGRREARATAGRALPGTALRSASFARSACASATGPAATAPTSASVTANDRPAQDIKPTSTHDELRASRRDDHDGARRRVDTPDCSISLASARVARRPALCRSPAAVPPSARVTNRCRRRSSGVVRQRDFPAAADRAGCAASHSGSCVRA